MRKRLRGIRLSLAWIIFQTICSAATTFINLKGHHALAFWIWLQVPVTGLICYDYGRLDQVNVDLGSRSGKSRSSLDKHPSDTYQ